jgi:hypothetical protein
MPSIELYLERAETLAQDVVNAWGTNVQAGNGPLLTSEFNDLLDKACRFRTLKSIVENQRQFGFLSESDAVEEETSRSVFAATYKVFWEKRQNAA